MNKYLSKVVLNALAVLMLLFQVLSAEAAITQVATTTANTGSTGVNTLTISVPAGAQIGDLLTASVVTDNNHTIVTPTGWTRITQVIGDNGDKPTVAAFYRLVDGAELSSYDFTWSGNQEQALGAMTLWDGVDTDNPIGAISVADGQSNNPTAPDVATTVDDSYVVRVVGADDNDGPFAVPADHTVRTNIESTESSFVQADELVTTAGSAGTALFPYNGGEEGEQWGAISYVLNNAQNVLQIQKSVASVSGGVEAGETLSYTVSVTNPNDTSHTGIEISDIFPEATVYATGSAAAVINPGGTPYTLDDIGVAAGTLVTGLTLDPGETMTITYDLVVDNPLPAYILNFANQASVTSTEAPDPRTAATNLPSANGFCPSDAFQIVSPGNTPPGNWVDVELVTGSSQSNPDQYPDGSAQNDVLLNGSGFNPIDGKIYSAGLDLSWAGLADDSGNIGITTLTPSGSTYDYATEIYGPEGGALPAATVALLSGGTWSAGDINDGKWFLVNNPQFITTPRTFITIDVDPGSATYLEPITATPITITGLQAGDRFIDMVYHPIDMVIYAAADDDSFYSIDTTTGVATLIVDDLQGAAGTGTIDGYGAQYLDLVNNDMYISYNDTGEILRIDLDTLGPTTVAETFAIGPSASSNDGARCPYAPVFAEFGDAPDASSQSIGDGTASGNYNTLFSDNGPRHAVLDFVSITNSSSLMLGSSITLEGDGLQDPAAVGDLDDGVTLDPTVIQDLSYDFPVSVTNTTGSDAYLNAWADWNQDGDFNDAGEQIATDLAVNSNTLLNVIIPFSSVLGDTFMRFRYSTLAGLMPTGTASDGEVEDYIFTILPPPPPELEKTADDVDGVVSPSQTITYTLSVRNPINGQPVNNVVVNDVLPAGVTYVPGSAEKTYPVGGIPVTNPAGTPPNLVTAGEAISLDRGEEMTITLQVTVDSPPDPANVEVINVATMIADGLTLVEASTTNTIELPADLTVTKTLNTTGPFATGQVVEYQIEVSNGGPGAATAVTVNDTAVGLGGLSITAVNNPSADPGDCAAGSSFPCTIAEMASGEIVTLTITATVQ